jgi:hypothetical protein
MVIAVEANEIAWSTAARACSGQLLGSKCSVIENPSPAKGRDQAVANKSLSILLVVWVNNDPNILRDKSLVPYTNRSLL